MPEPRSGDAGPVIRSIEFYNIELAPLAEWQGLRVDVGNDGRRPGAAASHARDRVRHRSDDRRRACRYSARCSKGLLQPVAIPPAVRGRKPRAAGSPRRLFSFGTMVQEPGHPD